MDSQSELDLIRTILEKVDTTLSSEKILGFALDGIQDTFKCLAAAIILVDARDRSFKVVTARGWGYEFLKKFNASPFQGLVQEMADNWKPILITRNDSRKGAEGYVFQHDYNTLLALPLSVRGKPAGLLYLSWSDEVYIDDQVQEMLTDMARLCTLILDHGSLDAKVFSMSNIDALTGLYSYKFWHEELHREIIRAEKLNSRVAVMVLNLNKFKEFNAMHGHVKGDELLVEVSGVINSELDNLDTPCRVGGKWHVLLVGEEEQAVKQIAGRILSAFEKLPLVANSTINLGIGLSIYRRGEGEKALIERADKALMEARRSGGNVLQIM